MPERKGLAGGLIVGGIGGGPFIFNQMQTAFINPDNLSPDIEDDGEKYFSQRDLLERVPWIFVLSAGVFFVMQLIGILVIRDPPQKTDDEMTIKQTESIKAKTSNQNHTSHQGSGVNENNTEDNTTLDNENSVDLHPLQVIYTRAFYILWFSFLLNGQGVVIVAALYKAYGQRFIVDDFFLTTAGSFSAAFNCFGRIFWGWIADKFSFKTAMLYLCAVLSCLMFTFNVTELGGKPLYFIYVCLLFGSFSGNFSLFSVITAKSFGLKYYTVNYGLVFTSQAIAPALGAIFTSEMQNMGGWFGIFGLVATFSFVSMVLIMTF